MDTALVCCIFGSTYVLQHKFSKSISVFWRFRRSYSNLSYLKIERKKLEKLLNVVTTCIAESNIKMSFCTILYTMAIFWGWVVIKSFNLKLRALLEREYYLSKGLFMEIQYLLLHISTIFEEIILTNNIIFRMFRL